MAAAKRDELRAQLRLTTLVTEIDIDLQHAELYFRMRDEFSALGKSKKIWDTLDRRKVNRFAERSAASEAFTREPVMFALDTCDLLRWQKVPHLPQQKRRRPLSLSRLRSLPRLARGVRAYRLPRSDAHLQTATLYRRRVRAVRRAGGGRGVGQEQSGWQPGSPVPG